MGILDGVVGAVTGAVSDTIGGVAGGLLKMVIPQVDGIMSQVSGTQNMLQELVYQPIQEMLKDVEDTKVWRGPGADAFKEDVKSQFMPKYQSLADAVGGMLKDLQQSKDKIQQADDEAFNIIENMFNDL